MCAESAAILGAILTLTFFQLLAANFAFKPQSIKIAKNQKQTGKNGKRREGTGKNATCKRRKPKQAKQLKTTNTKTLSVTRKQSPLRYANAAKQT
jgi:hypothetical protein